MICEAQLQRLEQFLVYCDDSKQELETVNLLVQRNIPVTFTETAGTPVINDTIEPAVEPRILKAIPVHAPAKAAPPAPKVARQFNADCQSNPDPTAEKGLTTMASSNLMVGLEIGTSKICVVVGEGRPDGTIKILGVGQAPSRGVRKGEIVDFETAMKCVHEAVVDAEQKSDVMIRSVYVAVAGSHIQSFNNRGCVMLPEDRDEIDEQDVEDVKINAREVSIPAQNAFLHSIIQHYHVDGQDGVLNPVGMLGQKLEADFHIIHGVRTRIQNTIRCVKELPLDVGGRCLQRACFCAGGAHPASERSRRAGDRYRRRDDRLHFLRRRRGETKRLRRRWAATTSPTIFRWACASRWRARRN